MKRTLSFNSVIGLAWLIALVIALPAVARDLEAVADGKQLWLVVEDPDASEDEGPGRLIYHTSDESPPGELAKLDVMKGRLMKRGLAAGDGRLLMITEDRQVQTVRPVWSPLLKRYYYDSRSLPDLPEGCAVVSAVIGSRGPWLLVRVEVEDASVLDGLTPRPRVNDEALRRKLLHRALGLPEAFDFEPGGVDRTKKEKVKDAEDAGQEPGSVGDVNEEGDAIAAAEEGTEASADKASEEAAGAGPVFRLIALKAGRWVASPLPDKLPAFRHAELLMSEDDLRPTLIIEAESGEDERDRYQAAALIRYSPATPEDDAAMPGWIKQKAEPSPGPGRLWSAAMVDGQAVVAVERRRSLALIDIDAYLLRGGTAIPFGDLPLSTQGGARWSAMPWRGGLAVVASPGPRASDTDSQANPNQPIASLYAIGLNGKPQTVALPGSDARSELVLLREPAKPTDEGNLDLYIQIGTFAIAMFLMISVYRRAPRPEQIDLPDHIVLASFTRRVFAGFIDLTPGFLIAGAVFDTSMSETMLYWPGNGVPKVLSAMMPGFVVILVTVTHTTVFELVTARSLGKWFTGLYVADLSGKPAGPWPCTVRAASRVFDLLAPLIIVVAIISPARQRLGDIIARTTVVMYKPEPIEFDDDA